MKLKFYDNTDNTLIKKCRKQNSRAQKEVYERYASKMLSICKRYIYSADQAEDVMISAFVKVFSKIDQFKEEGSFEGWIRRIVVNEALTYLRANKQLWLEVDIDEVHHHDHTHSNEQHLEADDLMNIIQQLPVGYRTVFNMYAIEGYSHKEIADSLGISESTSKSQLSRARALLQKQLLSQEKSIYENIK